MVEVFKTNVLADAEAFQLTVLLQKIYPGSEVSFDLEDCDKVLRVESIKLDSRQVMALVREQGYECSILE